MSKEDMKEVGRLIWFTAGLIAVTVLWYLLLLKD